MDKPQGLVFVQFFAAKNPMKSRRFNMDDL
jgi:hypothetical protein